MQKFERETTGVRSYAGLELVAAELADEQPAVAAQVRERMRELITRGGLKLKQEQSFVRPADEDPRNYVS